jgi:hypothetical protein
MGPLYIFLSVTFIIGAIESLTCGNEDLVSSCKECGEEEDMCNGDCLWSTSSKTCNPYPIINPGELPNSVLVKIVVGYDHHFLKSFNGDENASKSAINKVIRDANIKLGHSNLKPGVKLEAREIYPVEVEVPLNENGVDGMPESHQHESVKKGAPFVLITGIGGGSGMATIYEVCNRHEESWVISSCETTDLVI